LAASGSCPLAAATTGGLPLTSAAVSTVPTSASRLTARRALPLSTFCRADKSRGQEAD
jgi:hypothetical protein